MSARTRLGVVVGNAIGLVGLWVFDVVWYVEDRYQRVAASRRQDR